MPTQLDKVADLSSVYGTVGTTFVPAVTNGLMVHSYLGTTLAKSLINNAPGGAVSVASGSTGPVVLTPAGVTCNGGAVSRIDTSYVDPGGAITVMIACSLATSGGTPISSLSGSNVTSGISLQASSAFLGMSLFCAYSNASSAPTSGNIIGAASNTAPVLAQLALPNYYVFKFDPTALKFTLTCPTAPTVLIGGSLSIAAGSTRPAVGNAFSIGSKGITAPAGAVTTYSLAIFNRVTTAGEDALMYAQFQKMMTRRGITI